MIDIDKVLAIIGGLQCSAPAPWSDSRGRIECANGNEMHTRSEIVEYLNWTFTALPEALAEIDLLRKQKENLHLRLELEVEKIATLRSRLALAEAVCESAWEYLHSYTRNFPDCQDDAPQEYLGTNLKAWRQSREAKKEGDG